MFWNTETVLAALDAGIAEVAGLYNEMYAYAASEVGPQGGAAHEFATAQVAAELNRFDQLLMQIDALVTARAAGRRRSLAAA